MHIPVLADEVLTLLDPQPGETLVDCTAGLGGHASLLAPRLLPHGTLVLNDVDPANLAHARARAALAAPGLRILDIRGNFAELPPTLLRLGLRADLLLADLGFSSNQVEDPARGLSFQRAGPLDMRLDPSLPRSAVDVVNHWSKSELDRVIREFGEDRNAARIARKLVEARALEPITTTQRLAEIVRSAFGGHSGGSRIDPATRTFQALRIAVNDEIACLEALLAWIDRAATSKTDDWLSRNARLAFIAFHSLEDRPVKHAFASLVQRGLASFLVRGAATASAAESAANPRARSAKLRAIRVLPSGDSPIGAV